MCEWVSFRGAGWHLCTEPGQILLPVFMLSQTNCLLAVASCWTDTYKCGIKLLIQARKCISTFPKTSNYFSASFFLLSVWVFVLSLLVFVLQVAMKTSKPSNKSNSWWTIKRVKLKARWCFLFFFYILCLANYQFNQNSQQMIHPAVVMLWIFTVQEKCFSVLCVQFYHRNIFYFGQSCGLK